ncbi:MAG: hypothetical protein L3J72_03640, partial [Thermoplasmata archaeon]|nr:hypothetical protein [Thermoplasmata archaeon]
TPIARAIARGATRAWATSLYGFALVPDLTVFLDARPEILLHRAIAKYGSLDYWESGMDMSLSRDRFESFFAYQNLLRKEFSWMTNAYHFATVPADREPVQVHRDVKRLVGPLYGIRVAGASGSRRRSRPRRRTRSARAAPG